MSPRGTPPLHRWDVNSGKSSDPARTTGNGTQEDNASSIAQLPRVPTPWQKRTILTKKCWMEKRLGFERAGFMFSVFFQQNAPAYRHRCLSHHILPIWPPIFFCPPFPRCLLWPHHTCWSTGPRVHPRLLDMTHQTNPSARNPVPSLLIYQVSYF